MRCTSTQFAFNANSQVVVYVRGLEMLYYQFMALTACSNSCRGYLLVLHYSSWNAVQF